MATATFAVTQKSATVKMLIAFYPKWSDDDPFDTLGNNKFLYKQGTIQFHSIMIWNDVCLE